jgi:hypothetical protein
MRKSVILSLCMLSILLLSVGCGDNVGEYEMGQEFTLPVGGEAVIKLQNLRIEFKEVTADSRCPRNVQCVWAGEASYILKVSQRDDSELVAITEPAAEGPVTTVWHGYEIFTSLEPYPQDPGDIEASDYRLRMTVKKNM